jgi:hypothetical protein
MRTDYRADDTALMLLDYTTPSLFDLSDDQPPMYDVEAPEFPWAPAWSSSPLGDPGVDDADLGTVDEYGPQARLPWTPVAAVAAAALGVLGLGVLVGVAADVAASPAPQPTVTTAAHSVSAPPNLMMSTAPSTTAVPQPTSAPASSVAPGPDSGPTFQVLPCNPMPFCI